MISSSAGYLEDDKKIAIADKILQVIGEERLTIAQAYNVLDFVKTDRIGVITLATISDKD